ncbi:MAG: DUF1326 domain-containing protein [Burkholderiales bacterium]|nr:DUF1326 domain-containing protein [Burkholderiales bacterium]
MATPDWQVDGQYYENCSCDYVCPCVPTGMQAKPTKGSCTFAMGFSIERGHFGDLRLDGLGFIVLGYTPAEMAKGNWSVGLVIDERADAAQRDAITGIASGDAGGPMAALGGLVGKFLGAETAAIAFGRSGASWSVQAGSKVRIEGRGAQGMDPSRPPLQLSYTGHPAADTFSLAHASNSHVAALGLAWDDQTGRNNAQYAPFSWRSS